MIKSSTLKSFCSLLNFLENTTSMEPFVRPSRSFSLGTSVVHWVVGFSSLLSSEHVFTGVLLMGIGFLPLSGLRVVGYLRVYFYTIFPYNKSLFFHVSRPCTMSYLLGTFMRFLTFFGQCFLVCLLV